jgi:leucyl/phenylalanyl-tRNA---protein transferase
MPIYQLVEDLIFPPPDHAERDGLLAVGGDLSSERILLAYQMGIFPWYSEGQPILWWSPDPRLIFEPGRFHVSRSLRRTLNKKIFTVTFDRDFEGVIRACATVPRRGQHGTWITPEMQEAYIGLHRLGFAHSAESWFDGKLAGGIYGVSLGRVFFGESMFSTKTDASKAAMATLIDRLRDWKFDLFDAQMSTPHLKSLAGKEISRRVFLRRLRSALCHPTKKGRWG